jgi:hypothetical protein
LRFNPFADAVLRRASFGELEQVNLLELLARAGRAEFAPRPPLGRQLFSELLIGVELVRQSLRRPLFR